MREVIRRVDQHRRAIRQPDAASNCRRASEYRTRPAWRARIFAMNGGSSVFSMNPLDSRSAERASVGNSEAAKMFPVRICSGRGGIFFG